MLYSKMQAVGYFGPLKMLSKQLCLLALKITQTVEKVLIALNCIVTSLKPLSNEQ